jgi:acyl-CoA synthetase (NDP forming)
VAVIGASGDVSKFGGRAFLLPLETGYRGALYPVNPNREQIWGVKTYASVLDIPGDIDLAVFTIHASIVPQAMEECVRKGVKGAVMITAGFAEIGEEGKKLQDEVVRIAHQGGIRFVGPNCMGIWSSRAKLNLCFAGAPQPGPISFISQSGTLGSYLFQAAMSKGYGFSKFVSSGNQASLNVSDYLEYLVQDEDTKAIVLYIEGVQEGRRFFETAKEVVRRKPIVVYKGGRTTAGSRATLSHTASLAGSDEVFDTACKQAGIIRCYEVMHPFDLAEALAYQPLPNGKRVTVIGSGGQCVATADACASLGLELPELDEDTKRRITEILAPHAPVPTNPIDTAATPYPMTLPRILEIVASLDYIDGIITQGPFAGFDLSPDQLRNILDETEVVTSIPKKYGKPLIATAMRLYALDLTLDLFRRAGIPYYTTPEESARAMYGLMKYGEIRQQVGES